MAENTVRAQDAWKYGYGTYRCPACHSRNVARSYTLTTFYTPSRQYPPKLGDFIIRCLQCGNSDPKGEV